jgi:SAM-dependent MidA family methyltransferase
MRFSEYMNSWLYGEDGYYRRFKAIGKAGDFYTAVSTSAFFGASIANFLYDKICKGEIPRDAWLIEIGAHQGYLLCDMIQWLYTCDSSLMQTMRFGIVERHPEIREKQKVYIASRFGEDVKVTHFEDIDAVSVPYAFYVANEIFDAFACELLKDGKIAVVENHTIGWEDAPEVILEWAKTHRLRQGEIAVGYERFAEHMAQSATKCDFITFDYGEKYVRNDFSIRLYKEHETFPLFDDEVELSKMYKKADITYDVNFAHVVEAFEKAGWKEAAYETQARALVRFGIIDLLERYLKYAGHQAYLREADKVKTLIAPTVMGDRFKMLHLQKH